MNKRAHQILVKLLNFKITARCIEYTKHRSTLIFTLLLFVGIPLQAASVVAAESIDNRNLDNVTNRYTPNQQVIKTLVVIGDSLSAGYGIAKKEGWVEILKKRLSSSYYHIEVVNASVSGETTFGGLTRAPELLQKHDPQVVIIELGGNDGLQGLRMSSMEQNLDKLVVLLLKRGIRVLLVGMKLPPNYGQFYTKTFEDIYQNLAKKYSIEFVPFMLKNIAANPDKMQADGIHPRANAQKEILTNLWPHLRKLLPKPRMK